MIFEVSLLLIAVFATHPLLDAPDKPSTHPLLDQTFGTMEYDAWLKAYGITYSDDEYLLRKGIFAENMEYIANHNAEYRKGLHKFYMGVNEFAGYTHEEFAYHYTNPISEDLYSEENRDYKGFENYLMNEWDGTTPDRVDWREHNAVTAVKNQGHCGSCWAFSATGSTEGQWANKHGELNSLSEQQLVSCAEEAGYHVRGCQGGMPDQAFLYIKQYGIATEQAYPYVSGDTNTNGLCNVTAASAPVAFVSDLFDVYQNNKTAVEIAVAYGPVSLGMEADASSLHFYAGGIFDDGSCGDKLNHGVLFAGFGEEDGTEYWLIKNSWGATWGEEGYLRIQRSGTNVTDEGICGCLMYPSYPIAGDKPNADVFNNKIQF